MGNRWLRASVITVGAIAVGVLIAILQSQRAADTVHPGQQPQDPFRDNDAAKALRNFLSVMYSQGDDAAEIYTRALEPIRSQAEAVVSEIVHVDASMRESDYTSRFALIFAASELRHPAALPWLRSIALSRIPAERSSDTHSFSTVTEETILRTTAVEGLGRLARDNNGNAIEALFDCLDRPSLSIRRAAVQELLQSPEARNQRDRIAAALPQDQRFLLDLRSIDIHDVPQARSPQQFLAPGVKGGGRTPPPPDDRATDTSGGPGFNRAPAAGKNPPPTLNRL
jgi:hypothetical protein